MTNITELGQVRSRKSSPKPKGGIMDEDYNDEAVLADLYGEDDWYEEDSALWN